MRTKTIVLFFLCSCFFYPTANAQYLYKTVNPAPDIFDNFPVDGLGPVLANGYLLGKIKGYRFAWEETANKWKPVEDLEFKPWDPALEYYPGDKVLSKEKIYEANIDNKGKDPASNSPHWSYYGDSKIPIGYSRYFPGIKDTLSKAQFLRQMVSSPPELAPFWYATYNYYQGDRVNTKEGHFVALADNKGVQPGSDEHYWERDYSGDIRFEHLHWLNKVSVLFNYSVNQSDTTWNPQIITVSRQDLLSGSLVEVVNFYFADAIQYLHTLSQPVANALGNRTTGNYVFVMWPGERFLVADFVKQKIKTKKISIPASTIINPKLYNEWIADTTRASSTDAWSVFQTLDTRDLWIVKSSPHIAMPFMKLSLNSIKQLYKKEPKGQPVLYSAALRDLRYYSSPVPRDIDSLAPLHQALTPEPVKHKALFFDEAYSARLDSGHNKGISSAMPTVCKLVRDNFYKHKIRVSPPVWSYFNDPFNWATLNPWSFSEENAYNFNDSFKLDPVVSPRDSIAFPSEFSEIRITYRKNPEGGSKYFEPVIISWRWSNPLDYADDEASFSWTTIKSILAPSSATKIFVDAVENGKLEFSNSEITYGMKEK